LLLPLPPDDDEDDNNVVRILVSVKAGLVVVTASGVGLSPLYCGHFWPIVPLVEVTTKLLRKSL
jgi:hypothetical protein